MHVNIDNSISLIARHRDEDITLVSINKCGGIASGLEVNQMAVCGDGSLFTVTGLLRLNDSNWVVKFELHVKGEGKLYKTIVFSANYEIDTLVVLMNPNEAEENTKFYHEVSKYLVKTDTYQGGIK